MMSLEVLGKNILEVEVTNISTHGIWLYFNGREFFLSYEKFPWFKNKRVNEIINVTPLSENHLYWEELDIDLTIEMIEYPDKFPLLAKD